MQLAESAHRKQSLANIGASQNLHTLLSRVRSEILLPFPPFTVALHWRHFHFISPSSLSLSLLRGVGFGQQIISAPPLPSRLPRATRPTFTL